MMGVDSFLHSAVTASHLKLTSILVDGSVRVWVAPRIVGNSKQRARRERREFSTLLTHWPKNSVKRCIRSGHRKGLGISNCCSQLNLRVLKKRVLSRRGLCTGRSTANEHERQQDYSSIHKIFSLMILPQPIKQKQKRRQRRACRQGKKGTCG